MQQQYDFVGWATKYNVKCADGRTLMHDAFLDDDGKEVPVIWSHDYSTPENVLGKALLKHCDEGVKAFISFNNTESGKIARELMKHRDISSLSIHANHLTEKAHQVIHGIIREVSLVVASANPETSYMQDLRFAHSDDDSDDIVVCLCHDDFGSFEDYVEHEDPELTPEEGEGTAPEDGEKDPESTPEDGEKDPEPIPEEGESVVEHADDKEGTTVAEEGKKPEEVDLNAAVASMNEEQQTALKILVGMAIEDAKGNSGDDDDDEGGKDMSHNIFEAQGAKDEAAELMHTGLEVILKDGKKCGSLKESFLEHADQYGISNIDYLFPEDQLVNNGAPDFIKRPDDWVGEVMNAVHHYPFSRIKTMFADITEDEARARGYIKGKLKKEEVFSLLKRSTYPQTIYKKQKLDRDDVVDITDFDVVAWLKTEMRMMLDEEIARAILFGDGRLASSDDKINETNVRPVIADTENNLYAIAVDVNAGDDAQFNAEQFIDTIISAMDDYEGSGSTKMFVARKYLTKCLLYKDADKHYMYDNASKLADKLQVGKIVPVPNSIVPATVYGVIVDLNDYGVGADKGGSVNMFDDFDIDYNQMKYLIETRISGALTKPHSALVLNKHQGQ